MEQINITCFYCGTENKYNDKPMIHILHCDNNIQKIIRSCHNCLSILKQCDCCSTITNNSQQCKTCIDYHFCPKCYQSEGHNTGSSKCSTCLEYRCNTYFMTKEYNNNTTICWYCIINSKLFNKTYRYDNNAQLVNLKQYIHNNDQKFKKLIINYPDE